MSETKPDLVVSDLLTERPVRRLIIKTADIQPGRLTLLEALDMQEASGIDADNFVSVLRGRSLRDKARLMYAFAWVVARRAEPDLTFEEVCTYHLEMVQTPTNAKAEEDRAKAVIAVAALAGVSPDEAKNMTLAEVAAVNDLHRQRSRRRTRKAG